MNPSSAAGAVSHKYGLSSEYENQKFRLYHFKAALQAAVSAASAGVLRDSSPCYEVWKISGTSSFQPYRCNLDVCRTKMELVQTLLLSYAALTRSSISLPGLIQLSCLSFDFPDLNYIFYNFLQNALLKLFSFFFPVGKKKLKWLFYYFF